MTKETKKKKKEPKEIPCCENCFFHRPVKNPSYIHPGVECHRFPPIQEGTAQKPDPYPFPLMKVDEWCGEYKKV